TTFPTVRYYLTLERELARAGVRYEYVEAGEVADFDGYRRA
ncbi:MAG TPA: LacI family transcriptional regulator, partial [Bifidobacterium sp.]|nr:LacI family transcriptional regulator [Bifidobacterium sp.]